MNTYSGLPAPPRAGRAIVSVVASDKVNSTWPADDRLVVAEGDAEAQGPDALAAGAGDRGIEPVVEAVRLGRHGGDGVLQRRAGERPAAHGSHRAVVVHGRREGEGHGVAGVVVGHQGPQGLGGRGRTVEGHHLWVEGLEGGLGHAVARRHLVQPRRIDGRAQVARAAVGQGVVGEGDPALAERHLHEAVAVDHRLVPAGRRGHAGEGLAGQIVGAGQDRELPAGDRAPRRRSPRCSASHWPGC